MKLAREGETIYSGAPRCIVAQPSASQSESSFDAEPFSRLMPDARCLDFGRAIMYGSRIILATAARSERPGLEY